jgi:hypothetical protein
MFLLATTYRYRNGTAALDGGERLRSGPHRFTSRKYPVPIEQEDV